jgi:hypothetical protein
MNAPMRVAALESDRADLDVFLKKHGLFVDWGKHNDESTWEKGLLHPGSKGSYGAVFKCVPTDPAKHAPKFVVKVSLQCEEGALGEQRQAKRKFSSSFMVEHGAYACVPHDAIVRTRARFARSSSLEVLRKFIGSYFLFSTYIHVWRKKYPWLLQNTPTEFLVMDLCEGGDLLQQQPELQPWYNPFHAAEPLHIVLADATDSCKSKSYVRVDSVPVVQKDKPFCDFKKGDVLKKISWACDQGQQQEIEVTCADQARSLLQRVHPADIPFALVEVIRLFPTRSTLQIKIGYSKCDFNSALALAVQKQLLHALWLLESYRIAHFDIKLGGNACCCSSSPLYMSDLTLLSSRQRVSGH